MLGAGRLESCRSTLRPPRWFSWGQGWAVEAVRRGRVPAHSKGRAKEESKKPPA